MANLNKIFLMGNLTRDPELRYVPSGTAVVSFGMATSRNFTTQTGEKKQETCFVKVIVWGKQAEACNQYLTKGNSVFVEGRLQYRSWDGPNGEKRSTLEVRADRVQFLSRPRSTAVAAEPQTPPDAAVSFDEDFSGVDNTALPNSNSKSASPAHEPFLSEDNTTSHDDRDLT